MNKIALAIIAVALVLGAIFVVQRSSPSVPKGDTKDGPAIEHSYSINLSNQGLESIPAYIFGETQLKELNISHNQIGSVQAEIRHLSNLRVLNLSNNQMTGVPAEIGQLQYLESLDLSNNKLTGLPYELGNLKNLQMLNISGNDYSRQDLDYIVGKLPPKVIIIK